MQINGEPIGAFLDKYFEALFSRLERIVELDDDQRMRLAENIAAKIAPILIAVENNYRNTEMETDTKKLLDLYYSKNPTISGYGVLFKGNAVNAPGKILEYLIKERKVVKHEMFQHANDEDKTIYNTLDIEQKVIKELANAFYGAFGQNSFHFYNPVLGPSVTYSGQHITISAILGFEGFMTGNIRFFSFDEVLKYIDNIDREPLHEISIRQKKTTPETVATWLKRHCEFEFTEDHDAYLDAVLGGMNKYQLERLFLKNNLFAMLGTPTIKELFEQCFDRSFMNSDKPTEANKEAIETLNEYFEYFLSYPYQWDDKERHIADMRRKCVIISDTDSTFLNIDPVVEWYERELNGGERLDKIGRIAVCNVMVYAITKFVEKIFWQLTKNMNIPEDRRKLISMKSEFNYSRIILTKNKKQYAGKHTCPYLFNCWELLRAFFTTTRSVRTIVTV